jgi:signal transduction histidine kinase/ligand-binding sensor domain-containing protein
MKRTLTQLVLSGFIFLLFSSIKGFSQSIKFDKVLDGNLLGLKYVKSIVQDKQGYIWFSSRHGLYRYDGFRVKSFYNAPGDKDSAAKNEICGMVIDSSGIFWFGTWQAGIARFDPVSNSYTYFGHHPNDSGSLLSDSVTTLFVDHLNNLWIGTSSGLDELKIATGKIRHFASKKNDPSSLSSNQINKILEDKRGIIWVGCGFIGYDYDAGSPEGGLNRIDPATGKITRYLHDPADSSTLITNKVIAIFEDSKENLWIGTSANGLHLMNRQTGHFTHYLYDPKYPEHLAGPPLLSGETSVWNAISLIDEDNSGGIWIGTILQGLNRYDPQSKKITHFGDLVLRYAPIYFQEDTLSGFREPVNNGVIGSFNSKDGIGWFGTVDGNLYKVIKPHETFPYYNLRAGSNSFYQENDSILWIGTSIKGLDRKNLITGKDTWFTSKNGPSNMPPDHDIIGLRADAHYNLWIGTFTGLYRVNLKNGSFTRFQHDARNSNSIAADSINCIDIDKDNLWIGLYGHGLDKMNLLAGRITHYPSIIKDSKINSDLTINAITEDKAGDIWMATHRGVTMFNQATKRADQYLSNSESLSICFDSSGTLWAGTTRGFYYFDSKRMEFVEYINPNASIKIRNVLHILEDNDHNLWLTTNDALLRLNSRRNTINIFGKNYGVHYNNFYDCDNYKMRSGQLLIGDQNGYYLVNPSSIHLSRVLYLNFTSFKIRDQEMQPPLDGHKSTAIWKADEIRLDHTQNVFSIDFDATDYSQVSELNYLFMMENYDNTWHDIGTDHKAYFFGVQPGKYIFHAKAITKEGIWIEKTIAIYISPPWWRTWWAITIFILFFLVSIWAFVHYRARALKKENRILEEKISHRTEQLKRSIEDLRSTQSQLVQSEKMASLGELTAGIAHEIQNPLNFINNFSEINKELLVEMKEEMKKGNINDAGSIADDIISNEEKINHHGKRADGIVKGMLQHSRSSTGVKEMTDINALADEYLRLSYHGLRAKDKQFNAAMLTDFDATIGKINIIPQEIGRVLLNLYNNAFYAVNEKKKGIGEIYEPAVSVSTKKSGNQITIMVRDNGNGISKKVIDKIFQPFFTTKPTGQGTGLGLSLTYDIVKVHAGEIKVESVEGEFTTFIILLPAL